MGTSTKKMNNNYKNNPINCWIITEGMAGTENQCLAIVENMDVSYSVKRIALQQPFRAVCPFLFKTAPRWAIKGIDFNEAEPDIIIASGRKAIPVALRYKDAFKVFIQNPKIDTNYFDLIASPEHDKLKGNNVLTPIAAPTLVNPEMLKKTAQHFNFSYLPNTKIAILVGGNSKTHTMPHDFADQLMRQINPFLQSDDYGFMVTVSRRTPPLIANELKTMFNNDNCVFYNGEGENPYHAYLAHADYILVTEDSTSMLSDACSTGKPTFRLILKGGSAKFTRLYTALKNRCGVKVFDGEFNNYNYKPLNDAKVIADEIKKAFAKKGQTL